MAIVNEMHIKLFHPHRLTRSRAPRPPKLTLLPVEKICICVYICVSVYIHIYTDTHIYFSIFYRKILYILISIFII